MERVLINNSMDTFSTEIRTVENSPLSLGMTGEIIDSIFDLRGNLIERRVGHNIIVNSFLNLVMLLLKDKNTSGIGYWAIGGGVASWDTDLQQPTAQEIRLTNEIRRVGRRRSQGDMGQDGAVGGADRGRRR